MTQEEYKNRLMEIRVKVNSLLDDLGTSYSDRPQALERLLNIVTNADFGDEKDGKFKTAKIISVTDFTSINHWKSSRPVYM